MEEAIQYIKTPGFYIPTITAIIIALIIAYLQAKEKKDYERLNNVLKAIFIFIVLYFLNQLSNYLFVAGVSIVLTTLILYYLYIIPNRNKGNLQTNYKDLKFTRFETIKEVKYGYIVYSPFFWLSKQGKHSGIGIRVLNEIFSFRKKSPLKAYRQNSNWDSIFEKLEKGEYDIILTPLFETRKRITKYNIDYCIPLFYSNIGLYVRYTDENSKLANSLSFDKAIEHLKEKIEKNWKGGYIKAELSQFLIEKHKLEKNAVKFESKNSDDIDFFNLIGNIADDDKETIDFAFVEVFKVESTDYKNKVVNILKSNELLYPVSFVVRKDHCVLKNLINLRIMELRATKFKDEDKENKLEQIIKDVATSSDIKIDINKFNDIFIQQYDFNKLSDK